MKRAFLTVMLLCLLVLSTHDAQAQEYAPGYYDQSWGGTELSSAQYDPYYGLEEMHNQSYPQQHDPYYELEVMHYRSYWPQFQTYQIYPYPLYPYPPYPIYPPCCVPGGY
jgi:hypothetical protein